MSSPSPSPPALTESVTSKELDYINSSLERLFKEPEEFIPFVSVIEIEDLLGGSLLEDEEMTDLATPSPKQVKPVITLPKPAAQVAPVVNKEKNIK